MLHAPPEEEEKKTGVLLFTLRHMILYRHADVQLYIKLHYN